MFGNDDSTGQTTDFFLNALQGLPRTNRSVCIEDKQNGQLPFLVNATSAVHTSNSFPQLFFLGSVHTSAPSVLLKLCDVIWWKQLLNSYATNLESQTVPGSLNQFLHLPRWRKALLFQCFYNLTKFLSKMQIMVFMWCDQHA